MGTRSIIGIENKNGTVTSIYCHWDGYPSNNGRILLEHYTDSLKVRKLIKLGSLSFLGTEPVSYANFDDDAEKEADSNNPELSDYPKCLAHAVRGDGWEAETTSKADMPMEEYAYLLTSDGWLYRHHSTMRWRKLTKKACK